LLRSLRLLAMTGWWLLFDDADVVGCVAPAAGLALAVANEDQEARGEPADPYAVGGKVPSDLDPPVPHGCPLPPVDPP